MIRTITTLSLGLIMLGAGAISASAQTTSTDQTAPVISGVGVTNITQTSAAINWTTNEPADSQVEYGTSTSYGTATPIYTATTTAHQITVSGLTASTTYHYIVKSKDPSGNTATSTDFIFATLVGTTTSTPPSTPPTEGVKLKIEPRVLNTESKGESIEAQLTLKGIYRNSDLDRASLKLNGTVSPSRVRVKIKYEYDDEEGEKGSMQIQMKFPRLEVIQALAGDLIAISTASSTAPQARFITKEVVVTGTIAGNTITAKDTIRILMPSWRNLGVDWRNLQKELRKDFKDKKETIRDRIKIEREALKDLRETFKAREKEMKEKEKERNKEARGREKEERKKDKENRKDD